VTHRKKSDQEAAECKEQLERLESRLAEIQQQFVQLTKESLEYQKQVQGLQFRIAVSRELL